MRTTTRDRRLERKVRRSQNGAEGTGDLGEIKEVIMAMLLRDITRDLKRETPRQQERRHGSPWASRVSMVITLLVALMASAALWFSLTVQDKLNYWLGG